ncbi:hypothetical protein LTR99_010778 [Exophiala xenobiotica]|uniref:Uncharacterized protein n=1 Tax=Vermiconidia calcicola TaxID=1690605 RepID=A0AAV9PVF7_9PEZI|nr:hypothetical protein H2202_010072 [Exophiala xenobiotica]KAK5527909.1 hypothetical protein LTR25_010840 [Vermiconidia calcicola]KAK5538183.1 hypothetical protein LTR23_007147 [Chaetothyriales sp. CCFEE 6169]KAK5194829.1 hypothetical protein LTR92_004958 [Exophiala xenobiotica]KAK5209140.1 hypothetical protein LTR41_005539 [Exophiala xenobiotica]
MTAPNCPHGSASDLWIMVTFEISSVSGNDSPQMLEIDTKGATTMHIEAQSKACNEAVEPNEKEVSGPAAGSPDNTGLEELSLPAATLQGPGIGEHSASPSKHSSLIHGANISDPSKEASDKPWKEEFVKHHKAIKRARKEAQRRLWQFENSGDPDIFITFETAFWSWVELVKAVRPVSKEYNNNLVEGIRAFINGLHLLMGQRSDELSTIVLATDLSLDWKVMDKQFEELRRWQLFADQVDEIFLTWVFDESMELFREWEDAQDN